MSQRTECPGCGSDRVREVYRHDSIPVQSSVLLDTRAEALAYPQHGMVLTFCDACGILFNAVFDLALVDYASATEESQHFSGTFNRFAQQLIDEIAATYDLAGRQVLEVGCGKGDFLLALAQRTGAKGLGIDPGFIPDRLPGAEDAGLSFRREFLDPATVAVAPDYIVCRHTLEHVPAVDRFVRDIAALVGDRPDVGLFFETPDVRRVLDEGAFWDIYYEHCTYFTLGSHARLFRRRGMDVTRLYLAYGEQYIIQHAVPAGHAAPLPQEDDLDAVRALAATFPAKVADVRARWSDFVRSRHAKGRRVAIWGGGSKGVAFLTTNGLSDEVSQVIDINPVKQGKYLPGTGHRVVAPEALRSAPPDTVIVMNANYIAEIGADLARMGLSPEMVAI